MLDEYRLRRRACLAYQWGRLRHRLTLTMVALCTVAAGLLGHSRHG